MGALDRGRMLVHTEEDWRHRHKTILDRTARRLWMWMIAVGVGLILYVLCVEYLFEPWDVVSTSWFIIIILSGMVIPSVGRFFKHRTREYPATGLYEEGLQITPYLFIPYAEIASAKRTSGGIFSLDGVRLNPRFRLPLVLWFILPEGLTVPAEFLGEDGVAELERRVVGIKVPVEPPRLVLYKP